MTRDLESHCMGVPFQAQAHYEHREALLAALDKPGSISPELDIIARLMPAELSLPPVL
ncbi:hypothetical protein [Mesorhizobium sp.]|uniref:hypothetical protein n=1 Tax=Mesorhizobium sp. TaxID=1871066 RepID=UPI0025E61945|nr:hypothetical protein [Mesorhizobium sp.]